MWLYVINPGDPIRSSAGTKTAKRKAARHCWAPQGSCADPWSWSNISNRRKFRSQTSDNMDRWKVEMGRVTEERRSEKRKSQKNEDADARKGRKVAKHCVFPMSCGSGGSKSRLAKPAGAEPAGQMRDEKLHAVVARSTFRSQNEQNTPGSDHFWKLRCPKSARRCGAKHISKSKCTKHHMFGPLLKVEMWKKCTPLWREAHVEVKMLKTPGVRTTFGGSDVASLHYTTLHYTKLHYTTLHYTPLHYTTLHYTTLHNTTTTTTTTLHSTTLHYTPLHSTTPLHYKYNYNYTTTLHYTPLHSTTLNYTTLHYTTIHSTTLHYTTLHYTTLHWRTLHHR